MCLLMFLSFGAGWCSALLVLLYNGQKEMTARLDSFMW